MGRYNLSMPLDALLNHWKFDAAIAKNIVTWQTTPARAAVTHPFPDELPAPLRDALSQLGIPTLYRHQRQAWVHTRTGKNVVLATGTNVEGEATASYIAQLLEKYEIKITRIASGVPMGGDLKYVDQVTLKKAMETRHAF